MEIDLKNYETIMLPAMEAYAKAAGLLGLPADQADEDLKAAVENYIDNNHTWYRNDMEYRYMGYDCGDCYTGGDIKKGIKCGEYLVVFAKVFNYKRIIIFREKHANRG